MEVLLLLAACWYVVSNGPSDLAHAVKGTTSPRHTERMARMAEGQRRREARERRHGYKRPKTGAARTYFNNVWEEIWEKKLAERPARMAKAAARREARAAKRAAAWAAVQEAAGRRWEARGTANDGAEGTDTPAEDAEKPAEAEDGKDTEATGPEKPAAEDTPAEDAEKPAEAEDGGGALLAPVLRLIPGPGTTTENTPQNETEGDTTVSDTSIEAVGLQGALDYTDACVKAVDADRSRVEQAIAQMAEGKVGETVQSYGPQIMEAYGQVESLFTALSKELQSMTQVRESYDAVPEAGEKDWLQQGR